MPRQGYVTVFSPPPTTSALSAAHPRLCPAAAAAASGNRVVPAVRPAGGGGIGGVKPRESRLRAPLHVDAPCAVLAVLGPLGSATRLE